MLEEQGVEIRTCGTCLNFYGISDKLQVGEVTNMYDIAERMTKADQIIKPRYIWITRQHRSKSRKRWKKL